MADFGEKGEIFNHTNLDTLWGFRRTNVTKLSIMEKPEFDEFRCIVKRA